MSEVTPEPGVRQRLTFRLLGPVRVRAGAGDVPGGPPRQGAVLAVLAVDAGRVVAVDTLVHRVWGTTPPEHVRRTLHTYVARIRRLLEQAGTSDDDRMPLLNRSGGYILDVAPEEIDWHRFRRLVELAGDAGSEEQRAVLLQEGLELWQGEPLTGVAGDWAARMRHAWGQQRLDAAVAWARAQLRIGKPSAVIGPVSELLSHYPLAEPLTAVLMRALCAVGANSDALICYRSLRQRLVEELGADPGSELQELHQAILRGELHQPSSVRVWKPARDVPAQLPSDVPAFTGRVGALARLDAILASAGRQPAAVIIFAVSGMAGVGKTALAVHWAHQIADRYPHGQLFIDLHGYAQGMEPIEPDEALDHMLRALGIPGTQVPAGLDQRAGLYRTRLAGQQMLIVLDNAATETQVQPLLPGSAGCLVLVTSRRRLAGLDHTHALSLDMLSPADAVTLFMRTAGEGRLTTEPPELVAETVELCGRLPLAIRVAAARLRSHPTWNLALLVGRLRDRQHRLVELEAGQRSVTAALDLSYQHLSIDQQQTYRLLGLHPGPDTEVHATAALLDSTLRHASRMLDQLLDAHLLLEPVAGRYRFHDLTRAHAAHTATRDETEPDQRTAVNRLLDHYRHTASLAMDAAYPYERERRPQVPPARTPTPDLPDPTPALGWLDTELPDLLAAARYAAEHGRPGHILDLSAILNRHLRTRGRYHDAETLHHQALATARATGHRAGELDALYGLGWVRWRLGRHEQAIDHFGRALQIARATGHRVGELDALHGLGHVHRMQGRHAQAADHHRQALRIARATGHRVGELDALAGLGQVRWAQGQYEQAIDHFEQALQIARAIGHRPGELNALAGLGNVHRRQSRHEQAIDHFEQALQIARATGHRTSELNALRGLGNVYRRQGRHEQATDHYQQLLDLARDVGSRNMQFEALQGLGRLHHTTGHPDAAIAHHNRALALAGELGQPDDQARAHDGLAHAYHTLNQHEQARRHWQRALHILAGLGVDHTDDEEANVPTIRAQLADLDQQRSGSRR